MPQPSSSRKRKSLFFSAKEVRAQAVILAVCLWTPIIFNLVTARRPVDRYLHTNDFLHFYTIGAAAGEGKTDDLYDWRKLKARTEQLGPLKGHEVFLPVYGPQVALFFEPWAKLPYPVAAPLWGGFTVLVCAACVWFLLRHCEKARRYQSLAWAVFFATPALWQLVQFGQTSALLLACFTLTTIGWLTNRQSLVGLGIGALFYKPHYGLVPALLLVATRQWKAMAVAAGVVAAQVATSVAVMGVAPWREYLQSLQALSGIRVVAVEPIAEHLHSLRTFWAMLLPSTAAFVAYLVSAAAVVVMMLHVWRRSHVWPLRISAVLLAVVLVTPHVGVYDLVILFPAWLLLAEWMSGRASAPWSLLYLAVALPLIDKLSVNVPLRFPILATAAMFVVTWRFSGEAHPDDDPAIYAGAGR